ncbi:MAG: SRPBCC family protein [Sphingomonas sp.]
MADSIHQHVHFQASPAQVYSALTQSEAFSAVTGAPAKIGAAEGDPFEAFGGMITGRQIELKPATRIVQAWRVGNWDEGRYSLATFELTEADGGTDLDFRQSGYPEGQEEHLGPGWQRMYWGPIETYLAANRD